MDNRVDELLTIIVPAYNVEKYIAECLDSLVNQTKRNHKIIIVNDGSTDGTETICLDYKNKYSDLITYIYQDNKGLGGARNTGMKEVKTPYLCFLDSDDWLNIRYVEKFTQLIKNTDEKPDIVFTLPWVYDTVTNCVTPWMDKKLYEKIFEVKHGRSYIQTNVRKKTELYALEVNACRKIYSTNFLKENKFEFPEKLKWEDIPGHFYLLNRANTCMALPEVGFFYRINQGGQITAGGGKSRLDMIPIFQQLLDVQNKNDFNETERAYVVGLILNYSLWSINVTNLEYIAPLLDGLHGLFSELDKKDTEFYLNNISNKKNLESKLFEIVKNEKYLLLRDYDEREKILGEYGEKKKGLIYGGLKCIQDHGLIYTIKWSLKKYLFK